MTKGYRVIGHVGVDAGMLIMGDPCYLIDSDLGKMPWADFLAKYTPLENANGDALHVWRVPYPEQTPAGKQPDRLSRAVVVGSGYGDGLYPVTARFREGRVMELRIKFD